MKMETLDNNNGDLFEPKSLKELKDYVKDVISDNNYGNSFEPKSLKELLDYIKVVIFNNYYLNVDFYVKASSEIEYKIARKAGFTGSKICTFS